jgi:hypothetical protein
VVVATVEAEAVAAMETETSAARRKR